MVASTSASVLGATEYEFTLRFTLNDATVPVDHRLERLAVAGCDDALPGIGQPGRIALAFSRSAQSAQEAVLGALDDARRAMPDARLTEATPDLVGLTDVAALMGFSRQNMRKLMLGSDRPSPQPVHESTPSLWHLAHVLTWLRDQRSYVVSSTLIDLANVTMQLNLAVECMSADRAAQREMRKALA